MTTSRIVPVSLVGKAVAAAGIFFLVPAANCEDGDRALGDGACPAGEVCSPATPNGLEFNGPMPDEGFFDFGGIKPTAVGGRQVVALAYYPDEVVDSERRVLDLPYRATVDVGNTVSAQAGGTVTLRGVAEARGQLRVTDPDDGTLYDRIDVEAHRLATVELATTIDELDGEGAALFTPGSSGYVSLLDHQDLELVDEDATITGAAITQTRWDRFTVGAVAPGTYDLAVTAGDHATVDVPIEVVAAPDRLAPTWGDTEVERGYPSPQCFTAQLGARPVHVVWSFTVDNATLEPSTLNGCVLVRADGTGAATLRASAGGLTISRVLPIVDAATSRARRTSQVDALRARMPARAARVVGHPLGDRAARR